MNTAADQIEKLSVTAYKELQPQVKEMRFNAQKNVENWFNCSGLTSVDLERFIQLYMTLPTEARISVDTEILKKIYFND